MLCVRIWIASKNCTVALECYWNSLDCSGYRKECGGNHRTCGCSDCGVLWKIGDGKFTVLCRTIEIGLLCKAEYLVYFKTYIQSWGLLCSIQQFIWLLAAQCTPLSDQWQQHSVLSIVCLLASILEKSQHAMCCAKLWSWPLMWREVCLSKVVTAEIHHQSSLMRFACVLFLDDHGCWFRVWFEFWKCVILSTVLMCEVWEMKVSVDPLHRIHLYIKYSHVMKCAVTHFRQSLKFSKLLTNWFFTVRTSFGVEYDGQGFRPDQRHAGHRTPVPWWQPSAHVQRARNENARVTDWHPANSRVILPFASCCRCVIYFA